ncbi:50S ribosomal protein L22 [Candidatus Daviesbacteria bacterium]|nr:50S ribosomal protein L22 [Candidatus Daviesbacteria bacterium]
MEITTIQKYIHTSPRKLRLVADMVRKLEPVRALDVLRVTPKYAAKDLTKALETVLANAKQSGLDIEKVAFKKIEIDESMKMRRFRAGTRGRVKPYKKRMAHIKIVLSDELRVENDSSAIKKEKGGKQTEVVVDDLADKVKSKSKVRAKSVQK